MLTLCAVGTLAASNQSWAAEITNCAQVTGTTESDVNSTPNNKTDFQTIFDAVAGPDGNLSTPDDATNENDEACRVVNVVSIFDYGDAPDSYGTTTDTDNLAGPARHEIIPKLSLGALIDDDDGTLTNADANADDNDGASDEDGYTVDNMMPGQNLDWDVIVTNETGSNANLVCWIDYNGDGTFATDGSESGSMVVPTGTGAQTVTVDMPQVPADVMEDNLDGTTDLSESYARCRLSTDAALTELAPAGAVADGEVEDRKVTFVDAPVFDLALRKSVTDSSAKITAGDTVSFNIEVINQGTVDATGVIVTDYIPAGMELDPSDTNWTQAPADAGNPTGPQIATLNTPIAVSAGQSADPVLTIKLRVLATVKAGDLTNAAEISSATNADSLEDTDSMPDSDGGNDGVVADDVIDGSNGDVQDDHDIAVLSVSPTVDVELAKTVFEADGTTAAESVRRGDTLIYVLTVVNNGPDNATNVTVTDQLPAGLTYVSDDTAGAAYDETNGLWTVGDLNLDATKSLRITVTVD